MPNSKLRRVSVGIVLLALILLTAFQVVHAQQPIFRIGVLDDDTGPISNGARLAVRAINDAGGVQGADGTVFRLELVIQPTDGGANIANAVANLNQASVIAVLGPETNNEVLDGLTALQSLNVPIITPAISDTLIVSDTTRRLFRSRAAEVWQGRALADFLIKDYAFQRIATVQLDIDSTAGVIGFSTAASALGVQPQPALLLQSSTEMPNIINSIVSTSPDIVIAFGEPEAVVVFYNLLRSNSYGGLFGYYRADDPS
ncbi:MAG: ABC transporter substrate-binding protein, partial [Burkholderiales bacterium]|nr:ABC transporter substrate-binding protein [Anaerolineae bacterium]